MSIDGQSDDTIREVLTATKRIALVAARDGDAQQPLGLQMIADVFNIFNRPNWTVGVNEATPAQFLQHVNGTFRTMQFGFRLTY